MDRAVALAAFDTQLRRDLPAEPGGWVERAGPVVRTGADDGWNGVVWSDLAGLGAAELDAVIRAQAERFAGVEWEWKHYSYDEPAGLADRLLAAGLEPDGTEALMVAEIDSLALDTAPPPGLTLVPVTGPSGADALVRVHDAVFGGTPAGVGRQVLAALDRRPPPIEAVVAMAGDVPVSAARVEFHPGGDFAGLWGGGTLPEWRGRGVFRALVAYRAARARDRGVRWLQVDASADSRPILERLGFTQLATTTPYRSARR